MIKVNAKNIMDHLCIFLFLLAILLLPFNDLPYLKKILGELSAEGAFYPIAALDFIYAITLLSLNKIKFPRHISVVCLLAFLCWAIVASLVNIHPILLSITKGRTGIEKLLLQILLMVFVMISSVFLYNIAVSVGHFFHNYRKYIAASFFIVAMYSVIEILFLLGNDCAKIILEGVNKFIHSANQPFLYIGRVRSVSGEASWFAIYCSFIFPWLLSYVYTARKQIWLIFCLLAYLFLLVMLTFSRTAYVIMAVQLVLFTIFTKMFKAKTPIAIGLLIIFSSIWLAASWWHNLYYGSTNIYASLFSMHSGQYDLSNIARYGSMVTAFKIGVHHAVFGVGLGQYGFYMANYVPDWAKVSYEIQSWMSAAVNTPWAPVHNIYARIFAELGIIGLGIWLFLWLSLLYSCWQKSKIKYRMTQNIDIVGMAVILSIIGCMLSGLNLDSFRIFEYWLTLAIAWVYLSNNNSENHI